MNEMAKWLRGEIEQFKKAEDLGVSRTVTRHDAVIAYRRAAEEIEELQRQVAELQSVRQGP